MDFTQYGPVFARLVDAEADDADFVRGIELDLGHAVAVEAGHHHEVVRELFELAELRRCPVGVLEQNLDRRSKKSATRLKLRVDS